MLVLVFIFEEYKWTVFDNLWDWESEVHQQVLKLITENWLYAYMIKI